MPKFARKSGRAASASRRSMGGRRKSRSFSRRPKVVRRRKSVVARTAGGPNVRFINPKGLRGMTVTKTTRNIRTIDSTTSLVPATYVWEPTGLSVGSPNSQWNPVSGGSGATIVACPDFQSFKNIYDEYKIHYIKLIYTYVTLDNATGDKTPKLYSRWNYEDSSPPQTGDELLERSHVKCKTFTQDSRVFSQKCYPIYDSIGYLKSGSAGVPGISAFIPKKMGWCRLSEPPLLYGHLDCLESAMPTGQSITVDVEYKISFRDSR